MNVTLNFSRRVVAAACIVVVGIIVALAYATSGGGGSKAFDPTSGAGKPTASLILNGFTSQDADVGCWIAAALWCTLLSDSNQGVGLNVNGVAFRANDSRGNLGVAVTAGEAGPVSVGTEVWTQDHNYHCMVTTIVRCAGGSAGNGFEIGKDASGTVVIASILASGERSPL